MKQALIIFLLSAAISIAAPLNQDDPTPQVKAYLEQNGYSLKDAEFDKPLDQPVRFVKWPMLLLLPADWPDYAISKLPAKYRKIVAGQWVEKTQAEKDAADESEITNILTNDINLMTIIECVNEAKGNGAKDIAVSHLVQKIKSKKVK